MNELILSHHGIKGQRWGVRRYQNADGSLTSAGRKRYGGETSTLVGKKNIPAGAKTDSYGGKGVPKGALSLVPNHAVKEHTGLSDEQKEMLKTMGKAAGKAASIAKESSIERHKAKLEKSQKRASYKAKSIETRQNMSAGKKAIAYILGGPFGPTNYSNYKVAGYSDKAAMGRAWLDGVMTGGLLTGHSNRVRNKAADKS